MVEAVVDPDDGVDGGERERFGCELVSYIFGDVYRCFEMVFIRLMTTKQGNVSDWFSSRSTGNSNDKISNTHD